MRVGTFLPLRVESDRLLREEQVAERAQLAEAIGLDSIWITDNIAPEYQPRPDPLLYAHAAAIATAHIEVGTGVYLVSNRNPVDVAQRILTLDQLVPGRITYGVGAGSTEGADLALGTDFSQRFANLHRNMDVIRRLCRGEHVGHAYLGAPADFPPPRFLLGAWSSDVSLRRAVADYDGWMASGTRTLAGPGTATLSLLGDAVARYRTLGGSGRAIVSTVQFDPSVDAGRLGDDEPFNLRCPPAEATERVRRLADLGYDDLLVVGGAGFGRENLEVLRSLA